MKADVAKNIAVGKYLKSRQKAEYPERKKVNLGYKGTSHTEKEGRLRCCVKWNDNEKALWRLRSLVSLQVRKEQKPNYKTL